MNKDESLALQVQGFMQSIGRWPGAGEAAEDSATLTSKAGKVSTPGKPAALLDASAKATEPGEAPPAVLNKNFSKLSKVPLVHLKRWMSMLECGPWLLRCPLRRARRV